MSPEEQLTLVEAISTTLKDPSSEVRKEAMHCLLGLGLDGLGHIIDAVDDSTTALQCKIEAVEAIGRAFSEGKVDRTRMVKSAVSALEACLGRENEALAEAAIIALGEIGPQAINSKPKLLKLLEEKRENNRIRVKIGLAMLKISPIN